MKAKELKQFLSIMIESNEAIFIWGPPGVGKSSIVKQLAQERQLELIDLRATLLDPVDLRGVPIPATEETIWLRPSFLPKHGRGILFLDELNSAPPAVQAACYQLVLDRRVGEHELPPNWVIIAAGNREGEGVVFRMPAPLANRFIHVELEPSLEDWVEWALGNDICEEVIAFLRFRPDLLFKFDPTHFSEKAFPTPRSWEKVSKILALTKQNSVLKELLFEAVRGCVGEGPAVEFCSFLRLYQNIPTFEEILFNPATVPVPDQLDLQYAIAVMISKRLNKQNFSIVVEFIKRLSEEMQVLIIKDALKTQEGREIVNTRAFVEWASKHAHLIL